MSPGEVVRRVRDEVTKRTLGRQLDRVGIDGQWSGAAGIRPDAQLPPDALALVLRDADEMLAGRLRVFATTHDAMGPDPDWFFDPRSGLRAPSGTPFHAIGFREWPGSLKHVWEPSRHQHLTVLAVAARETGEERYVELLESQLKSWWEENPPFMGVHWVSGIEIGLRLLSWVWIRRILPDQDRARALFEANPVFRRQLAAHQLWLSRLPSLGSSANNHLVAEAAGLFASACCFPVTDRSDEWRDRAAEHLEVVAANQIGADGVHAELATDYHGFVAELLILAGLDGEAAGHTLSDDYWRRVRSMIDTLAAFVDVAGRPPRQGDSDGGFGMLLDGAGFDRWGSLLRTGTDLFGAVSWWPEPVGPEDARSRYLAAMGGLRPIGGDRHGERPGYFPDSGMAILRGHDEAGREIWCRLDAGPIGYLKTAAHGHADALSIELRHAGVDVLADPGTYCYQWDPGWRAYFRSTEAHNTVQVHGAPQAEPMGSFMWGRAVNSETEHYRQTSERAGVWTGSYVAKHRDGPTVRHRRSVEIDGDTVEIRDSLDSPSEVTLRFHLGPAVDCHLEGAVARLSWPVNGDAVRAELQLPSKLEWQLVRGSQDPPMGWYAPDFDELVPSITLEGAGHGGGEDLVTRFRLV